MHLTIISGSHRPDSNSAKVAQLVKGLVSRQNRFESSDVLDLYQAPLPLFNDERGEAWQALRPSLEKSSAFVVITPEWHGMVPAGLKNFFLYCTSTEVGHKPALIVSVSSGVGGSYPIAELRASSYKNNRLCFLPEHVILRNVASFLQLFPAVDNDIQRSLHERLEYTLALLHEYAVALEKVRQSSVFNSGLFPNGM